MLKGALSALFNAAATALEHPSLQYLLSGPNKEVGIVPGIALPTPLARFVFHCKMAKIALKWRYQKLSAVLAEFHKVMLMTPTAVSTNLFQVKICCDLIAATRLDKAR
ncbi:hypothetical protein KCP75_14905 [Salmonella enterica subsp. enterica]|nr:hypothetical protein KCP75_14905 [Salmonella enterica subsp. enterica]